MKYLHAIASVDPSNGGPIEGVSQLSRQMSASGHTVHVVSCDDPAAPYVTASELNVIALGPGRGTYAYTPRLVPWLRENAPAYDVVVVNGLWQFPSFAVMRSLRRARVPYLVFTHGMLDPWFKHAYPLKHLKKWAYWPWAEYRVLKNAHSVLFTSEEERVLARESFWLYRCDERVVAYGTAKPLDDEGTIEAQREAFFARYPDLRDRRIILCLARIHPKKGCDLAIRAFAAALPRDPRLHLVMAGPDQVGWRPELERLAQACGVAGRVTWTGMVEKDLKWGALRVCDAYLLPSHQENFGISVAEALACGVPVLISDKVNIWREIAEADAGLVEADTDAGARRLIDRWLDLDYDQRCGMRGNAERCFRDHFEIGSVARGFMAILRESVDAASRPALSVPSFG